jgi:hypothetical protein
VIGRPTDFVRAPAGDGETPPAQARHQQAGAAFSRRRRLARQLRRAARSGPEADPIRRRYTYLLPDRVSATRAQLLEFADLIERSPSVDPHCLAELRTLLTSGCDSPLCNEDIHVSELHARLYFLQSRLQDSAG